jgi:integrase
MDLLDFWVKYLDHSKQHHSRKVYDEKRYLSNRFLEYFGHERLVESLTKSDIQNFLDDRAKSGSGNSANKDRKNLKALWNYGIEFESLQENPTSGTIKFRHDKKIQYTPSTEDVLRVLAAATRREKVFLLSYVYTGARRSEIFRWVWDDDINFEQGAYRLGTRKTEDGSMSYEWFPMPDELYNELRWLWNNKVPDRKYTEEQAEALKRCPYVFPNTHPHETFGKPFTQRRWFLHELCEKAEVKPFGYHALRRFFASRLKDIGKGTKTIQRMLRHQHLHTTEKYIQSLNDDLSGVTEGLLEKKAREPGTDTKKERGTT